MQIAELDPVGRAYRHRHAMQGYGIALPDGREHTQRLATFHHKILRDHFDEVHGHLTAQELLIVGRPQSQAETLKGSNGSMRHGGISDRRERGSIAGPAGPAKSRRLTSARSIRAASRTAAR